MQLFDVLDPGRHLLRRAYRAETLAKRLEVNRVEFIVFVCLLGLSERRYIVIRQSHRRPRFQPNLGSVENLQRVLTDDLLSQSRLGKDLLRVDSFIDAGPLVSERVLKAVGVIRNLFLVAGQVTAEEHVALLELLFCLHQVDRRHDLLPLAGLLRTCTWFVCTHARAEVKRRFLH